MERPRNDHVATRHGANQDPEVLEHIESLAAGPYAAAVIHRKVEERFPTKVPGKKTVERIVHQFRRAAAGEPWRLLDTDAPSIASILRVVAHLLEHDAHGGRTSVNIGEAAAIVRVAEAAPDLAPHWVWEIASKYASRTALGWPVADLDNLLALAPWRGEEAFGRYVAVLRARFGDAALPRVRGRRVHYAAGAGAVRTAVLMVAEETGADETKVLFASGLLNEPPTTDGPMAVGGSVFDLEPST